MSKSKKIKQCKQRIKQWPSLFKCPVCDESLAIREGYQLQCGNNHNFDLSSKGYVNLLAGNVNSSYDKKMLESRKKVIKAGLFDPLINRITALLTFRFAHLSILDAGCGEGSLLKHLLQNIDSRKMTARSIGLDISKSGINIASRGTADIIWCVGDIAHLPLTSSQFNVVLNILSPANYKEFSRVLQEDGHLLKVIPARKHLQELRDLFHEDQKQSTYNPQQVIQHAKRNFANCAEYRLTRKVRISSDTLPHVVKMTPLSWRILKPKQRQIIKMDLRDITTDYHILIGKIPKDR